MAVKTPRQWGSSLPQRKTPLRASSLQRKAPQKPRKQLPRRGKKTNEWDEARAKLKIAFERAGITTCEHRGPGCWISNALGFAHTRKRRFITTPEQLLEVALLCCVCHDATENTPDVIREIIASRPVAIIL